MQGTVPITRQHQQALANRVLFLLETHRFRFNDETDLQDGIEQALIKAGLPYEREKVLGPLDRADFLIHGCIVLEVKIKGSLSQALRQIYRYTAHEEVIDVLLVGTPGWLNRVPGTVGGKPVLSLQLLGSLL